MKDVRNSSLETQVRDRGKEASHVDESNISRLAMTPSYTYRCIQPGVSLNTYVCNEETELGFGNGRTGIWHDAAIRPQCCTLSNAATSFCWYDVA